MAHASRNHAARALTAICLGVVGSTALTTLAAAPAHADETVEQARDKVERLTKERRTAVRQLDAATTRLRDARIDLQLTRGQLSAHRAALAEVQDRLDEIAAQEGRTIGRALTAAVEVTTAPDPEDALEDAQDEIAEDLSAPETAEALAARVNELQDVQQRQAVRVQKLTRRYRAEGHDLRDVKQAVARAGEALADARERAAASRSGTRTTVAPASSGASAAIAYAMAQVGDAYSYGSAGPDAFDCSGLMMMAWAQAGVSLPRTSSAQAGAGTPVSIDALQPGDLVFYYSPVSHIGMYIGNGQIVHAGNPSTGVRVDPVGLMPISGAVRPG